MKKDTIFLNRKELNLKEYKLQSIKPGKYKVKAYDLLSNGTIKLKIDTGQNIFFNIKEISTILIDIENSNDIIRNKILTLNLT